MRDLQGLNKSCTYMKRVVLLFMIRTIILGFAFFKGSYFSNPKMVTFKFISIFLDVTSIFQFIFMLDVFQRKSLLQLILYVPLLIYSLTLALIMIFTSYKFSNIYKDLDLTTPNMLLYLYGGFIVLEMFTYGFICNKLKTEFVWSNFKRVGADPIINGKVKKSNL